MMTFRNNQAVFLWGFASVFLLINAAMTYVLIRDGTSQLQVYPPDIVDYYPPWFAPAVLAVFWLAGYGLAAYVATKPCIRVAVLPDRTVMVKRRYPFKTDAHIVRADEMPPAQIVESLDDEDSPYFRSRITLPDGLTVDIAEGHNRELCETACIRFNSEIAQ
jgi:hypothetical protein